MSLDFEEMLFELLVRVRACRRHAQKVEYSREDGRTLWDGGDRVEHADGAGKYSFYVTLHHFSGEDGEGIGQHVALACADVRQFAGGEEHRYRLRRGTGAKEHLSVYVYNPSVHANGPLRFEVRTTDALQGQGPRCVEVAEDTCPVVLRFGCASMQASHVTELRRLEHAYRIRLKIEFFGETQRVERAQTAPESRAGGAPRRWHCMQCCDARLDCFRKRRDGRAGGAPRRWHCTHCFELRHWI